MKNTTLDRRGFIKHATAATAGMAALAGLSTLCGCAPGSGSAGSDKPEVQAQGTGEPWDEETDVIVVGVGGAGAAASLEAQQAGAAVIAFESQPMAGGCSALCGQMIAGAETSAQREAGIADTVEDFAYYLANAGATQDDIAQVLAKESAANIEWLEGMGVTVTAVMLNGQERTIPGVVNVPRLHTTDTDNGGIWTNLYNAVQAAGVDVRLNTPVASLVKDPQTGEVTGVVADGKRVKANKAVIMCASGFARNVEMLAEHITKNPTICQSAFGSDGSGISMCMDAGVATQGWGGIWRPFILDGDIEDRAGGVAALMCYPQYLTDHTSPSIQVTADGKRFRREDVAMIEIEPILNAPGGKVFHITSGAGLSNITQVPFEPHYEQADTIAELAGKLGIDGEELQRTVEVWNANMADGSDPEFGREAELFPFGEGPFYGIAVYPGLYDTLASPLVNADMQVLAALDRQPIGGLYAASAGILGRVYAECGTALGTAIATGRIAGRNAAALPSRSEPAA